jgi:hypothetical protein
MDKALVSLDEIINKLSELQNTIGDGGRIDDLIQASKLVLREVRRRLETMS